MDLDRLNFTAFTITALCLAGLGFLVALAGWVTARWNRRRP